MDDLDEEREHFLNREYWEWDPLAGDEDDPDSTIYYKRELPCGTWILIYHTDDDGYTFTIMTSPTDWYGGFYPTLDEAMLESWNGYVAARIHESVFGEDGDE